MRNNWPCVGHCIRWTTAKSSCSMEATQRKLLRRPPISGFMAGIIWLINGTGKVVPELRSYGLNCYLGTPLASAPPPVPSDSSFRLYTTSASLAADGPARRFTFIDVNPANICTPAFGVDMVNDTWVHYPSFLHGGRGVVSFADSHVESHKWVDPRTRRTVQPGEQYIGHSDSSPGNQDLYWIRDRTTSRK